MGGVHCSTHRAWRNFEGGRGHSRALQMEGDALTRGEDTGLGYCPMASEMSPGP